MAQIFISFNGRDLRMARQIQAALVARGHSITLPVDAQPAGRWEIQLLRALRRADAFVGLLTPNGAGSAWVVGQTGQAIAYEHTEGMLVLPVLTQKEIPNFVAAFHCFWLEGRAPESYKLLAKELHQALISHSATQPPRVFISHRHHNQQIAASLIRLLESAFDLKASDIRCTSVPGYKLPVGAKSADSLQRDLEGAEVVIGIIGPETSRSDYVLFELGASWGLGTPTFPLRVSGATYENVPEVLREKSSLALEDVNQCLQLIEDFARVCSVARKKPKRGEKDVPGVKRRALALAALAKRKGAGTTT